MTIDEDINLFSPLGYRPPDDGMYITGELIRKMHEEHKKQEKEKAADNTKKLLSGLYKSTAPKVIHDESVVGIYQDKLTGDVILGQPQPVTTVDQSFSMRGITQLPPEDEELKAVMDPLIKTIKITATAPPEIEEIPIGFSVIPKGMFNRMRFEVWKYALNHLDKSDKIEFPFKIQFILSGHVRLFRTGKHLSQHLSKMECIMNAHMMEIRKNFILMLIRNLNIRK